MLEETIRHLPKWWWNRHLTCSLAGFEEKSVEESNPVSLSAKE